jgi:hypothetical protein
MEHIELQKTDRGWDARLVTKTTIYSKQPIDLTHNVCFDVHRRRRRWWWWWCSETYRAPEHWLRLGCKTCDIPQSIIVGKSPPISRTELEVYRRRRWWCNGTYKDSKHWLRLRCKTYVTYTTIHYKQPTHLKHNIWKCTKEDNLMEHAEHQKLDWSRDPRLMTCHNQDRGNPPI